jgi:RHS repeat-associated protein
VRRISIRNAAYDVSNILRRKYIYGPSVDEPVCLIESAGSYAGTYYYHFDALGSVVALTSGNVDHMGETVEVYEYDVYGRLGATDASHPNRMMFTGREYDKETGLYYYRARYYNPQIGRFLETDPVGYEAGMNWYTYCGNNSTNGVDPSGLLTIYLYNEYAEGLNFFYELSTGSNRVEWDLAGVANAMCVDPSRLEPVFFPGYGSGYVVRGGGTGAWNPAGKAGNREVITTDGPVAYTPIDTGPLDDGAPTRISSEPVDGASGVRGIRHYGHS